MNFVNNIVELFYLRGMVYCYFLYFSDMDKCKWYSSIKTRRRNRWGITSRSRVLESVAGSVKGLLIPVSSSVSAAHLARPPFKMSPRHDTACLCVCVCERQRESSTNVLISLKGTFPLYYSRVLFDWQRIWTLKNVCNTLFAKLSFSTFVFENLSSTKILGESIA